jgi:hypothetical protein
VTSLIEAHGGAIDALTRPRRAGQSGWPLLLPNAMTDTVLGGLGGSIEDALDGVEVSSLELGDPGSVLGHEVPLDELPDYAGPPEPVGGPPPEWGAAAADQPDPDLAD